MDMPYGEIFLYRFVLGNPSDEPLCYCIQCVVRWAH